MPDRDPALEAAVQQAIDRRQHDYLTAHPGAALAIECDVTLGYDAALRSLGVGTPEAQAALREVIRTTLASERLPPPAEDATEDVLRAWVQSCQSLYQDNAQARRTFATLATPTEEGR